GRERPQRLAIEHEELLVTAATRLRLVRHRVHRRDLYPGIGALPLVSSTCANVALVYQPSQSPNTVVT
ncbi:MAG: hypothetical protein M3220_10125, partial [Chloroflexota bacterium]|nr:hypothetical protein [Chloroflexota bacterium]